MKATMIDTRGYLHRDKTTTVCELGTVDIAPLRARVAALGVPYWAQCNARKPNKFDAFGPTQHIVMKFVVKLSAPTEYVELPPWQDWRTLVEPILDQVQQRYGYQRAEFPRVMLAKVPAGGEIAAHSDGGRFPPFCHKVHVPLLTNPKVGFYIEPNWYHLAEGVATEVNNAARHMVMNAGESDRVHLVFELFKSPLCLDEHQRVMPSP